MAGDKENQDDAVTKSLVALLGDLASNVTGAGPVFAQKTYVQQIIQARTLTYNHLCAPGSHFLGTQNVSSKSILPPLCSSASAARNWF